MSHLQGQSHPQQLPAAASAPAAVSVRLLRAGEGASALAIAAGAGATGAAEGQGLQAALDQDGGRVAIADLPGAAGWCFGASAHQRLVGMTYACSPVGFILAHDREHHAYLTQRLVEIEILAVEASVRGQGVGSALLGYAERYLGERGVRLFVAKVDSGDMPVLRWYRHRGYTLAHPGESCVIDTPAGATALTAGPAHDRHWRLALKAPGHTVNRGMHGLRLEPPLPRH